jgi:6-phosphofructokinase 1
MAERGENSLIAVAGQATAVTNSVIAGIIDEAGKGFHIADIFGAVAGVPGLLDGKLVDLGAQKRKTIEGLRRTPGSLLSGRHRMLSDADAGGVINALRSNNIGTVFMLGGVPAVGLMRFLVSAAESANYPLQVLGIPISAENDVEGGDHTPGYGSAARFVATAARDAGRAASGGEEPLLVLEVPGAGSGWLAASAALAQDGTNPAPHAILLPERAVDIEVLTDEARRAYQKHGYAVVVTTESVKDTAGNSLDGAHLTQLLSTSLGVAGRFDKPGSLCRVGQSSVARADAEESYNLGSLAVRLAGDECSGYLITIQRDMHTADRGEKGYKAVEGTARLEQVADTPRQLPAQYISESGTQVTQAFLDWARPLIGGALPEYINLS